MRRQHRSRHVPATLLAAAAVLAATAPEATASDAAALPLVDAHVHYSHDAWEMLPPPDAVAVLREARLSRVFVSSSSDDGTQRLYEAAPDLIVPVLRPYRRRGELRTWMHDETVVAMLAERLARYTYAGIGEFHVFGDDADVPVVREVVRLAREHRLFLHAHSDAGAVERLFAQDPEARVLWAHSGFADPDAVREMLGRYPNLRCDLAFRTDHAARGKVDERWRELFIDYPERFMIGTDTYTPERWYYVVEHARWTREWLSDLPEDVARRIAHQNAEALAAWAMGR